MPRAAGICQGAGGSKVVEPFAPFVLLALLHIGGGEFEIIRKPDLTRDDCAMASFHIEDQDRGAGAWCFSAPDEAQWRPTDDLNLAHPICGIVGWCGRPPPTRKRGELVPHICGFGGCWPITTGPGNTLMPAQSRLKMEAFTLVVWFMLGSEMKVERIENLTRAECIAKLEEVLATGRLSATCRRGKIN